MPTSFNHLSRLYRVATPVTTATLKTSDGRVLNAGAAAYLDVPAQDMQLLTANGWSLLMEVGTTANRPVAGSPADIPGYTVTVSPGHPYYDTTASKVIFWNAKAKLWVDISGASA